MLKSSLQAIMVSSNYSYLMICLHAIIWFQVTNNNNNPFSTIIALSNYFYDQ